MNKSNVTKAFEEFKMVYIYFFATFVLFTIIVTV